MDIYLPGGSWCFPVRWEPLKQDIASFWSKIVTKVRRKVLQNGDQVGKIVFSSLDGKIRVEDVDEFAVYIERALETKSGTSGFVIQLRVIVSKVCLITKRTRVCMILLSSVNLLSALRACTVRLSVSLPRALHSSIFVQNYPSALCISIRSTYPPVSHTICFNDFCQFVTTPQPIVVCYAHLYASLSLHYAPDLPTLTPPTRSIPNEQNVIETEI